MDLEVKPCLVKLSSVEKEKRGRFNFSLFWLKPLITKRNLALEGALFFSSVAYNLPSKLVMHFDPTMPSFIS